MPDDPERPTAVYRMLDARFEVREDTEDPVLTGHFSVFNEWTRIDSLFEGTFMERIAPGSFAKTFRDAGDKIKVLFNHGRDPSMGMQTIGTPKTLTEDDKGAFYEVQLNRGLPENLMEGLRKGQYGSSFKWEPLREQWDKRPARSQTNPDGIPERTVKEVKLYEFGPVTFPAYAGATASVRSLTDLVLIGDLAREHQFGGLSLIRNAPAPADAAVPTPHLVSSAPRGVSKEKQEDFITWLRSKQ